MKNFSIVIYLFIVSVVSAQQKICKTSILNKNNLFEKNEITKYQKYDFSKLWTHTDNNAVFGVIGDNYERILIKLISIKKDLKNQNEYVIYGKSQVKGNICDFTGTITITKIQEIKNPSFGNDDEYKDQGIKSQGLLTAKYKFIENKTQKSTGDFEGTLQTIWYLDKNNSMRYNDIDINSDSYFNNAFVGTWKSDSSQKMKLCNWGDYRVPNVNCDFDIGAAEVSVSDKYKKNGWLAMPKINWWK